jgi:hypothetical protein
MIKHCGKTVHQNGMVVIGSIDMRDGVIENLNRLCIDKWSFDLNEEGELCINYEDEVRARITNNNEITINLHYERYFMVQPVNVDKCIGLLVSNLPRYYNLDITQRATDQALPTIYLSDKTYDPTVMGVIVGYEKYERTLITGTIQSVCEQGDDLNRVLVTNRGTTTLWVCDINGSLQNGDYITSSGISGYGMRQEDNIKYNYTVTKITQNCDFKPGFIVMEKPVDFDDKGPIYEPIKSVNEDIITDVEYEMKYVDLEGNTSTLKDLVNDLKSICIEEDIYEDGEFREDLLCHQERSIFRVAKVGCCFT